ncbi:putative permease [Nitrobacteraceae bacterium AZCC 1564]
MDFSGLTPVIVVLWIFVVISILGQIAFAPAIDGHLPVRNIWLIIWHWISGGCWMTIVTIATQAYSQKVLSAHWTIITIVMTFVVVFGLQWWINRRYPKIEAPES